MPEHITPALKQSWVLDTTWTDCPEDVKKDVEALWRYNELGNDNYMLRKSIKDLVCETGPAYDAMVDEWDNEAVAWVQVPLKIDNLINYLREKNIPENEQVIIHYWW